MKNMKKILVMTLAALLLVAVSVAGTVAYLTTNSKEIVNTFNPSFVAVDVVESTGEEYQLIPGTSISKDPKVTFSTDVDAYLFVQVEEYAPDGVNFSDYIGYSVITGEDAWKELPGEDNVYYREVAAGSSVTADEGFNIIQDNDGEVDHVSVPAELDLEDMKLLQQKGSPELSFRAFIIQKEPFGEDVETAWENVDKTDPNPS